MSEKNYYNRPLKLNAARAWRTYFGGKMIEELHGNTGAEDTHFPEEWITSVVSAKNAGREHIKDEGLSYIEGTDVSLKAIIEADPEKSLGKAHFEKFGATPGVLVKLLDAAERLGVQAHPTKEKAGLYFDSDYGKTECWHIIGTREIDGVKPCVYMGFKDGVTKKHWRELFDSQDINGMLDCLNKIEVKVGDTYLITGGMPHAIGSGCFLVEIQEPTDYTLRTERVTPSGLEISEQACHYGIGFDKMFECFEYNALDPQKANRAPIVIEKNNDFKLYDVIGYRDSDFFSLKKLELNGKYSLDLDGTYCGIYVLSGDGKFVSEESETDVKFAEQYFVPAGAKKIEINAKSPMVLLISNGPKI